MRVILLIFFLFLAGCSTSMDIEPHCAEAIKAGEHFKIYFSEQPAQMNKDYPAPDISNGFYILEFEGEDILNFTTGIINFEHGIASVLNGC